MIEVTVNRPDYCPISNKVIFKLARIACRIEPNIKGKVEITFVSNASMRKINLSKRGIDRPTDVISFAFNEDNLIPTDTLGELYLSYKYIVQQAKRFKVSAREETIRMLSHGLLHISGHDHVKSVDAKKMFSLQEKIVANMLKYL